MTTSFRRLPVFLVLLSVSGGALTAQTVIKLPKNKFTPEQDVQLGKEGAAEVRKQYPVIQDDHIKNYLDTLGHRLIDAAPPDLKNPVYEFSFTPVNLKEINAFALPGGPMFVNRGMVEAAASEGEVVGVMAHELSHVLLRHGTANATKAQNPWLQLGQMAGMVGGAMVGGAAGSAIAQGSQFGLGTLMLRYSRDYEKQADLMGAQIMARAGYDPRALAHMFDTIAKQSASSGGGNPQWMSDHPDPGNRTQYITKEAESLTLAAAPDMSGFQAIKTTFASLPAPRTMGEMARGKSGGGEGGANDGSGGENTVLSVGTPGQPVQPPAAQFHDITGGKVFQASIPNNWTALTSKTAIKVVPVNGYGDFNGQKIFSHGVEFGLLQASSQNLQEATNAWIEAVGKNNPQMKLAGDQQMTKISGRNAVATTLLNPSPLGGQERVSIYTTFLNQGTMFYYLTVVSENDAEAFRETFRHIGASIRLAEIR